MKRVLWMVVLCWMMLALSSARAEDYAGTIASFKAAGQTAKFFDSAYGYAVFPTIGKVGFIFGGAFGRGQVYARGTHVGNAAMTQATVGFQFGGQAYSQMIFFENEDAFKRFTSGNFEFGADASVVAITAGAGAKLNTAGTSASASSNERNATAVGQYIKGMATFVIPKGGLMFEASVGGQKFDYKELQ